MNSVYYWDTKVRLNPEIENFIHEQEITAVYLHLFDVRIDKSGKPSLKTVVKFENRFPSNLDIIPVITISSNVVNNMKDPAQTASFIVDNATKILTENGYPAPSEIQIDYDWTKNNQKKYFILLEDLHKIMKQRDNGQLSVTVRIRHLKMHIPPADYAVLMLYTLGEGLPGHIRGTVENFNSIVRHIQELKKYPLPLATALDMTSTDLVYDNDRFRFAGNNINLTDTNFFVPVGNNIYKCLAYDSLTVRSVSGNLSERIFPGDIVYHSKATASMLDSVASIVSRVRSGDKGHIILFQLNDRCIDNYSPEVFKEIFAGGSNIHTFDRIIK